MKAHTELPKTEFNKLACLRYRDLVGLRIVFNRVTLARWIRAQQFPAPIKLGKNSVAWRQTDIQEWLESRAKNAAETTARRSA